MKKQKNHTTLLEDQAWCLYRMGYQEIGEEKILRFSMHDKMVRYRKSKLMCCQRR